MPDDINGTQTPPPPSRRSSFAGQTFADLFGPGRSSIARSSSGAMNNSPPTQQFPGPITTAAAQAQQRRLSVTTLGLGISPNASSPFASLRARRDSSGTGDSSSIDESAIEDDNSARDLTSSSMPSTPFARRMSFGARALRDVRTYGGGGGSPGQNGTMPPPTALSKAPNGTISARDVKGRGLSSLHAISSPPHTRSLSSSATLDMLTFRVNVGASEGFNWSDNFRTRAQRTTSGVGQSVDATAASVVGANNHTRAQSVAVMEPAVREMPKQPQRPDHFQERILKGDFYMD